MLAPVDTTTSTMLESISVVSACFRPADTSDPASVRMTTQSRSASISE